MKTLLSEASLLLRRLGYHRKRASFWMVDRGVYRLIDFQGGAYGGYFFVNVCLHPVGLPKLQSGCLSIPEEPKEYECIIRSRVENVVSSEATAAFRRGLVTPGDTDSVQAVLAVLSVEVQEWLAQWGDLNRLAEATEADLGEMLTVAPSLRRKACRMLAFFCSVKTGRLDHAPELFLRYANCNVPNMDLSLVDDYLCSLMA